MSRTRRIGQIWFRLSIQLPVAALVIIGLTVTALVTLAMQFHTTSYLRSETASASAVAESLQGENTKVHIIAEFTEKPDSGFKKGDSLIWYTEEQGKRYAAQILEVNQDPTSATTRITAEGVWNEELGERMKSSHTTEISIVTEVQSQSQTVLESWIS
ncbi:hypothetical protein MHI48_26540 [Paenibacillus sp. FSL H7-0942]|uniref:Uncharacterized protein n=1 Tax=Paenibacillus amylolyticus TaxID=1451 RepID=A0ABD8AQS0_PAEAM|nr:MULTISPECIES: hypothetical protein [Paenibacillus]ETT40840.1 hypothetical protein C161_02705 [Paenibacillus sp. FSL R5-192]OME94451.1 hypothetical protein BK124_22500 [Paenibacillus amylolyticus]OMF04103.1 hypothetical protein BK129_19305 [Paenibacillus amylolyticus]